LRRSYLQLRLHTIDAIADGFETVSRIHNVIRVSTDRVHVILDDLRELGLVIGDALVRSPIRLTDKGLLLYDNLLQLREYIQL
jgi:predicted transcriptional regulator